MSKVLSKDEHNTIIFMLICGLIGASIVSLIGCVIGVFIGYLISKKVKVNK